MGTMEMGECGRGTPDVVERETGRLRLWRGRLGSRAVSRRVMEEDWGSGILDSRVVIRSPIIPFALDRHHAVSLGGHPLGEVPRRLPPGRMSCG